MILTPDVMEDGLVHMVYADEVSGNVLILIVVDNGLVQRTETVKLVNSWCLNPYCNGQWSRTQMIINV